MEDSGQACHEPAVDAPTFCYPVLFLIAQDSFALAIQLFSVKVRKIAATTKQTPKHRRTAADEETSRQFNYWGKFIPLSWFPEQIERLV
ncbi:hypothetical protein H6F56_02530 [Microcoleus sp. FACHB-672]|nr:hypothetical protein [Microcoleus sp. FACHB-672]